MQTYIAHYSSPAASDARAKGLFEFESESRAGSKANLHDARVKMLELYGSKAVSWNIVKVERKQATREGMRRADGAGFPRAQTRAETGEA